MVSGAVSANMVSSDACDSAPEIVQPENDEAGIVQAGDAAEEARAAVWVGLYVSAARCLLTYVVAPAVGAFGVLFGPLGLVLQVLGTITAISGARRLWALRHRGRMLYGLVAAALTLFTAATAGQLLVGGTP